jgi:hypothetical protein
MPVERSDGSKSFPLGPLFVSSERWSHLAVETPSCRVVKMIRQRADLSCPLPTYNMFGSYPPAASALYVWPGLSTRRCV